MIVRKVKDNVVNHKSNSGGRQSRVDIMKNIISIIVFYYYNIICILKRLIILSLQIDGNNMIMILLSFLITKITVGLIAHRGCMDLYSVHCRFFQPRISNNH